MTISHKSPVLYLTTETYFDRRTWLLLSPNDCPSEIFGRIDDGRAVRVNNASWRVVGNGTIKLARMVDDDILAKVQQAYNNRPREKP